MSNTATTAWELVNYARSISDRSEVRIYGHHGHCIAEGRINMASARLVVVVDRHGFSVATAVADIARIVEVA